MRSSLKKVANVRRELHLFVSAAHHNIRTTVRKPLNAFLKSSFFVSAPAIMCCFLLQLNSSLDLKKEKGGSQAQHGRHAVAYKSNTLTCASYLFFVGWLQGARQSAEKSLVTTVEIQDS